MPNIFYYVLIFPFEFIFRSLLSLFLGILPPLWALPMLSVVLTLLSMPLFAWSSRIEAAEKALKDRVKFEMDEIKNQYSGEALFYKTEEVYKKFSYNPLLAFRESMTLFVLIPLFAAAYIVLNNSPAFFGAQALGIADLSRPDALLWGINVLPFIMTGANLLGIYIEGYPKPLYDRGNIKLLVLAAVFLVWLYGSSAALLIYWTFNNIFFLARTLFFKNLRRNHG